MLTKNDIDPATLALMKQVSEDAACSAIRKTLTMLGIDANNPVEFQKDTAHLRAWRKRVEKIEEKSMLAVVLAVIGVIGAAIWLGVKTKFGL